MEASRESVPTAAEDSSRDRHPVGTVLRPVPEGGAAVRQAHGPELSRRAEFGERQLCATSPRASETRPTLQSYGHRLNQPRRRVTLMFVLFHKRVRSPLANSLLEQDPTYGQGPPRRLRLLITRPRQPFNKFSTNWQPRRRSNSSKIKSQADSC